MTPEGQSPRAREGHGWPGRRVQALTQAGPLLRVLGWKCWGLRDLMGVQQLLPPLPGTADCPRPGLFIQASPVVRPTQPASLQRACPAEGSGLGSPPMGGKAPWKLHPNTAGSMGQGAAKGTPQRLLPCGQPARLEATAVTG